MLNILMGWLMLAFLSGHISGLVRRKLEIAALSMVLVLGALYYYSDRFLEAWHDSAYAHKVIWAEQTPYQHLAVTQKRNDTRLYINRVIQFSTRDEYRYHEVLGLIPMAAAPYKYRVLILGGGEGLLAREVLKHPEVEQVTIVDLDTAVFKLGRQLAPIRQANNDALNHPKVRLIAQDASVFLRNTEETFDVILADLPDPSNDAVARLYSVYFFKLIRSILNPNGVFATQATSPFHTSKAFWSIGATIQAAGFTHTYPMRTFVPSFGEWGFHLASMRDLHPDQIRVSVPTRYLDSTVIRQVFYLEKDIAPPPGIQANELDRPVLLEYFLDDWSSLSREKSN
jgi:spermidine synthase